MVALGLTPAAGAAPPEGTPPAQPAGLMMDGDAFARCESDGLLALALARQAFWFDATPEELADAARVEDQSMVAELFQLKEDGDLRNHLSFAWRKLRDCTEREGMVIGLREAERITNCYARVDVAFLLAGSRDEGRTQAEAIASVKKAFARNEPKLFPDALPSTLAPVVFRRAEPMRDREVGRQAFASCAFPRDWNAWRKAHTAEAHLPAAATPARKAAAPRTIEGFAQRFARCAVGMSWHVEVRGALGRSVDHERAVVKHFLRVGCRLVGPDELHRQWKAQNDALHVALRGELKKGKPEAAVKKTFGGIDADLDACAAQEEEIMALVREVDPSTRDACELDFELE